MGAHNPFIEEVPELQSKHLGEELVLFIFPSLMAGRHLNFNTIVTTSSRKGSQATVRHRDCELPQLHLAARVGTVCNVSEMACLRTLE